MGTVVGVRAAIDHVIYGIYVAPFFSKHNASSVLSDA